MLYDVFMIKRLSASKRGYNYTWRKVAARYLLDNPSCVMCKKEGYVVPSQVVDHITPHKGDKKLFWDINNWQALCKKHHDNDKLIMERVGFLNTIGADGWPIDSQHPINKKP